MEQREDSKVCMGGVCEHDCHSCNSCTGYGCGSSLAWTEDCGTRCATGRGHYALRWLLGLIILGVMFSVGVMFGKLSAYVHQDRFDYQMMRRPNMMYYFNDEVAPPANNQ